MFYQRFRSSGAKLFRVNFGYKDFAALPVKKLFDNKKLNQKDILLTRKSSVGAKYW